MMQALLLFVLTVSQLLYAAETAAPQGPSERAIFDKEGNPRPDQDVNSPDIDWEILKNANGENDRYQSSGAMIADDSRTHRPREDGAQLEHPRG